MDHSVRRRQYLVALGGTALSGLAGCGGLGGGSAEGSYDIGMSAQRFLPAKYEVAPGTTLVWKNTGSRPHTVTAYGAEIPDDAEYFASGGFESEQAARDGWIGNTEGAIVGGESYSHTFTVPGEYEYFCIPHEPGGMKGTIVVTEAATRTPRGNVTTQG
jgi:plastocyanin